MFVFYIAGHGKTLKAEGDYYFVPPGMDAFTEDEIKRQGFGPDAAFGLVRDHPSAEVDLDFRHLRFRLGRAHPGVPHPQRRARRCGVAAAQGGDGRTMFMASGEAAERRSRATATTAFSPTRCSKGSPRRAAAATCSFSTWPIMWRSRVPELSRELKVVRGQGAAGVLPEAGGDARAYAQLSRAAALSQGARHAGRRHARGSPRSRRMRCSPPRICSRPRTGAGR